MGGIIFHRFYLGGFVCCVNSGAHASPKYILAKIWQIVWELRHWTPFCWKEHMTLPRLFDWQWSRKAFVTTRSMHFTSDIVGLATPSESFFVLLGASVTQSRIFHWSANNFRDTDSSNSGNWQWENASVPQYLFQESPPIGGAVWNATRRIAATVVTDRYVLPITCSDKKSSQVVRL